MALVLLIGQLYVQVGQSHGAELLHVVLVVSSGLLRLVLRPGEGPARAEVNTDLNTKKGETKIVETSKAEKHEMFTAAAKEPPWHRCTTT